MHETFLKHAINIYDRLPGLDKEKNNKKKLVQYNNVYFFKKYDVSISIHHAFRLLL